MRHIHLSILFSFLILLLGCPTDSDDDASDDDASDDDTADDDDDTGDDDTSDDDDDTGGTDADGDGWTVEDGDCDDDDPDTYPGAPELCDGLDNNCDGTVPNNDADIDGDGVSMCAGDCDDQDASVHPGATEVCDGVDNNCDGTVDEAADGDGDGFNACDDCDDTDAAIHPGANEDCDGVDQDCDGDLEWEIDNDGDGLAECAGDCDDGSPWTYPGAFEVCDEWFSMFGGWDTDCDGYDCIDADGDAFPFPLDCDDNDFMMYPDDYDGDGYEPCDGDCDDNDPTRHPGAVEICDDGIDQNCDGQTDEHADQDGDGFTNCTGDCDDFAAAAFPGGIEVCDGVDNDCDGYTDPGFDLDWDGFDSCTGDCDDDNPVVNPLYPEICDGLDTDCDGVIPADEQTDADGDGYPLCMDCDDTDPAVHPGAQEICGDGIDNDCDGWPLAGGLTGSVDLLDARYILGGEFWGDRIGWSVAGGGDLDGDGDLDLMIGSPYANSNGRGTAYAVTWPPDRPNVAFSAGRSVGSTGWGFAYSLAIVGDVNDDGADDMLVGAPGSGSSGRAYLFHGPLSTVTEELGPDAASFSTQTSAENVGYAVAAAGDMNQDGYDDLLIGGPGSANGTAYLIHGPASGDIDLATADAILTGATAGSNAGRAVASAGDVDNDGNLDILVGAPAADGDEPTAGAAYLLYGPVSGNIDLANADAIFLGEHTDDYAGRPVVGAGDINGDGYDDILIGAFQAASYHGRAYVFYGPVAGSLSLSSADAILEGVAWDDVAAHGLAGPGDLNNDGYNDVVVGSPGDDSQATDGGAVHVFYGPTIPSGLVSLSDAQLVSPITEDTAGWNVTGAGDLNQDGCDDLLIGAASFAAQGKGYVVFGGDR